VGSTQRLQRIIDDVSTPEAAAERGGRSGVGTANVRPTGRGPYSGDPVDFHDGDVPDAGYRS
jgi:hypothetical protein